MDNKDLNLRAGLGAFADENGNTSVDLEKFDVVNRNEDLILLLVATGISFTRRADELIGAEAYMQEAPIEERIVGDDLLAAARRVAARVAASWVTDKDVRRYKAVSRRDGP